MTKMFNSMDVHVVVVVLFIYGSIMPVICDDNMGELCSEQHHFRRSSPRHYLLSFCWYLFAMPVEMRL